MSSGPDSVLRVVMVEDSAADAELLLRALRATRREIDARRVESESDLRAALVQFDPHLVLSGHAMPGLSGLEALRVVTAMSPSRPFIFVSGTIGEEAAIDAVRRGAADYVFKHDLRRLATAVENALHKYAERDARTRAEAALRRSEERFRTMVESTRDWVWEIDLAGRITYSNPAVATLLGHEPADLDGRPMLELVDPDEREQVAAAFARHLDERSGWNQWRIRWRHRNGESRLLESTGRPMLDAGGDVCGFSGIDRDVTLRMQHEAEIRQLARIQSVLAALGSEIVRARDVPSLLDRTCRLAVEQGRFASSVVALPDAQGRLNVVSQFGEPRVIEVLDSLGPADPARAEHAPRPLLRALRERRTIALADPAALATSDAARTLAAQADIAAQVAIPVGTPPWAVLGLFSQSPMSLDPGEIALLERIASDLDHAREFIAKSDQLQFLAYRNPVTGLPNSAAFQAQFQAALARGPTTVGALDVVRPGAGYEGRGRRFGEHLQFAVASRLLDCVPSDVHLAHAGGDGFLFAQPSASGQEPPLDATRDWLTRCAQTPVEVDGEQVHFSLRAGLALAPLHGRGIDDIERAALAALADATRRDQPVAAYSQALIARADRRRALERELRIALANEQFELFLQPKFESASRRLSGAEALLRWRHPQHGLVSPGEFIPLLEDTGLIVPAGQWVMSAAVDLLRRWQARGADHCRIAINVSARELREQGFMQQVRSVLCDASSGLDIEVTESLLMHDVVLHQRVLGELRGLGCRVSLDDFGTGYSSLSYLSRLPLDVLKIDRTFTVQMTSSAATLALVTHIIGMAHALNLRVVAEGVEEEEQARLLHLLRCDELQGFLLGRPVPVAEFERLHLC